MAVVRKNYYIREGREDDDDSQRLMKHDLSDWHYPEYVEQGLKQTDGQCYPYDLWDDCIVKTLTYR